MSPILQSGIPSPRGREGRERESNCSASTSLVFSPMNGSVMGSLTGVHPPSPPPPPPTQALGFQNNSLFTNFSTTNLCEHIQLVNNVFQSYAQLWRNISPFQGCGEGPGRGCVAGMPPKPSASPESSLLLHLICSVSEEWKFARQHPG